MYDHSNSIYQTAEVKSQFNSQMPARDVSPIECAARELSQRIELLHDQIAKLRGRVHLVSSPQAAIGSLVQGSASGALAQPVPPQLPKSPLEEQLRGLTSGVDSAVVSLSNIMDYLQT